MTSLAPSFLAAADYGAAVREKSFPAEKHWFSS